jgi:hypothetical protein
MERLSDAERSEYSAGIGYVFGSNIGAFTTLSYRQQTRDERCPIDRQARVKLPTVH